jgi:hypothetical protein
MPTLLGLTLMEFKTRLFFCEFPIASASGEGVFCFCSLPQYYLCYYFFKKKTTCAIGQGKYNIFHLQFQNKKLVCFVKDKVTIRDTLGK